MLNQILRNTHTYIIHTCIHTHIHTYLTSNLIYKSICSNVDLKVVSIMEWFICKKVWSCRMVSVKMVLWNIKQNNIRTIEFKKHVEESHSWQIPGKCYLWFLDSGGNRKGILAWTGLIIISNLHLSHLTTA